MMRYFVNFFAVVVALAVLGVFQFFVFGPAREAVHELRKKNAELKDRLEQKVPITTGEPVHIGILPAGRYEKASDAHYFFVQQKYAEGLKGGMRAVYSPESVPDEFDVGSSHVSGGGFF